jgi:hypothetical protein
VLEIKINEESKLEQGTSNLRIKSGALKNKTKRLLG